MKSYCVTIQMKTSLTDLLNSTIYFFGFYKTKFDILLFFFYFSLGFFFNFLIFPLVGEISVHNILHTENCHSYVEMVAVNAEVLKLKLVWT